MYISVSLLYVLFQIHQIIIYTLHVRIYEQKFSSASVLGGLRLGDLEVGDIAEILEEGGRERG